MNDGVLSLPQAETQSRQAQYQPLVTPLALVSSKILNITHRTCSCSDIGAATEATWASKARLHG